MPGSAFFPVAPPESFHTPGNIHHPLLPGKKRMTLTAQLNPQFFRGSANTKDITTGAGYRGIWVVLRMNV